MSQEDGNVRRWTRRSNLPKNMGYGPGICKRDQRKMRVLYGELRSVKRYRETNKNTKHAFAY